MAKQKLGQHFLFDKNILRKIATVAKTFAGNKILEIGPGMGTLTEQLLELFENVYAVELDSRLCSYLSEKFTSIQNFILLNNDILKVDIESLPVNAAVGNIPYYITTPIIFKLLEAKNIDSFCLLMQSEVAKRIISKSGSKDYGILSVNVQFQADVKIAFKVGSRCFSPPPKVESAFVTFQKKSVPTELSKTLRLLTQRAFGMRRKTLFNNLKELFGDETEGFLREFALSQKVRAEDLDVETFVKMAERILKTDKRCVV